MSIPSLEPLREPFSQHDVKYRVGRVAPDGASGILFLYVDARACQDRLDSVLGVGGWHSHMSLVPLREGAVLFCRLAATLDGISVRRTDCCEITDLADSKAAASTAFKRACAALGVGRYLYDVGEIRVRLDNRRFRGSLLLPDALLPENERCGRTEFEIVYDAAGGSGGLGHYSQAPRGSTQGSADGASSSRATPAISDAALKNAPADMLAALNFTVVTGFCAGRPMHSLSLNALGWLRKNAQSPEERDAAEAVYAFAKDKPAANDDFADIPF